VAKMSVSLPPPSTAASFVLSPSADLFTVVTANTPNTCSLADTWHSAVDFILWSCFVFFCLFLLFSFFSIFLSSTSLFRFSCFFNSYAFFVSIRCLSVCLFCSLHLVIFIFLFLFLYSCSMCLFL
jgi:hypothetical protein